MSTFLSDFVYAFRKLSSARVFTATAVLTLALGIGGSTAIFTLMHAVMLKSLPVGDPDRLYRIGDGDNCCVQGGPQDRWGFFSFPLFERLTADTPQFEITSWHGASNPGKMFGPSTIKQDRDKLISPVLFVDGHVRPCDFTAIIQRNPFRGLEPGKDWMWYKPLK